MTFSVPTQGKAFANISFLPYGVGPRDGGICLELHLGPYRILLDCGLEDLTPLLAADPGTVDLVFCSHAHRDHGLGLWQFHQQFPHIPILASEVTQRLLPLNWPDEFVPPFCRVFYSWGINCSLTGTSAYSATICRNSSPSMVSFSIKRSTRRSTTSRCSWTILRAIW